MLNISDNPIELFKKNIKNMHLYAKPPDGCNSIGSALHE